MGKGDRPRNIGPKFQENFGEIDWRSSDSRLPVKVTDTKQVFRYGHATQPEPIVLVDLCPNPGCENGTVDTGGVTPWGASISDKCGVCDGKGKV